MQEHPLIELYVNLNHTRLNTMVEEQLSSVDLDDVVSRTLEMVGISQPVMLTLLVTDDEGIRDMNSQYRDKPEATDVLSFPLSDQPLVQAPADQLWPTRPDAEEQPAFITPPGTPTNLGDIVIACPTIVLQAAEAGHDSLTEFLYLLSHGVLHLVGFDDHTEAGYQAMVHVQQAVLQALGYKA